MPVSGKDNQEMMANKEPLDGGASMRENDGIGLGNGLDGGASQQNPASKRATRSQTTGGKVE